MRFAADDARREHRHRHGGVQERERDREDDHQRELREHLAGLPLDQEQRQEDDDNGQRRGNDGRQDLLRAGDGSLLGALAIPLDVPEDILEDDDGVVHDQADCERQAAQRHRIQRITAQVEEGERGDDRNRDGERHHQRAAHVAQEEEQDQDGEEAADHRVCFHVRDGVLDKVRVVGGDMKAEIGIELARSLHPLENRLGGIHGVGAALLGDDEAGGRLPIQARVHARLRVGIGDRRHVSEGDQASVKRAYREPLDLLRIGEPSQTANEVFGVASPGDARGEVGVFLDEAACDCREREVVRAQARRIHLYQDHPLLTTRHRHRSDAIGRLDDGRYLVVQEGAQLHLVRDPGHSNRQDRHLRRVELVNRRVLQRRVVGEGALGALHLLEHIHRGLPDIRAPVELDAHG